MPAPGLPGFEDLIERFDHFAVATHDIRAMLPLVDLLQGRFRNGGRSRNGFIWAQWFLPGAAKVELLEPLDPTDPTHFLVRFLDRKGPGLHHVTFKVRDLATSITRARERGFRVVGVNTARDYWREAFLHPGSAHGVLIQLAQWIDREPPPGVTIEQVLGADVAS